jgi:hypothetical protein
MSLNTIAAIGVTALIIGLYIIVQRLDRIIALQLQHRDQITASLGILSRQIEEANLRLQDAAERRPDADPALEGAIQRFANAVGDPRSEQGG